MSQKKLAAPKTSLSVKTGIVRDGKVATTDNNTYRQLTIVV